MHLCTSNAKDTGCCSHVFALHLPCGMHILNRREPPTLPTRTNFHSKLPPKNHQAHLAQQAPALEVRRSGPPSFKSSGRSPPYRSVLLS